MSLGYLNKRIERFALIKAYLFRYKVNVAIASAEKSYTTNLKKNKSVFDALYSRITGRTDIIVRYNTEARKLLFSQGLDYDTEQLSIDDLPSGTRTVQFSHAILIVSRFRIIRR